MFGPQFESVVVDGCSPELQKRPLADEVAAGRAVRQQFTGVGVKARLDPAGLEGDFGDITFEPGTATMFDLAV